jgi:hypothetical protein
MAMLVVLLQAAEGDVPLGSVAVSSLARLGVTNVAVLRDEQTICVVLEGWAFDPVGSVSEVLSTISAATRSTQTLHSAMQITLQALRSAGGRETNSAVGAERGES